MRKVRALLAAAVLICGLLWIGADVLGAGNPEMQVSSGTAEAAPGEDITFTFSLAGYDEIQEGIYALYATLAYDTDIFEAVEETDFETLSGWEQLRYNAQNGQLAVINKSGSVEDEDAFQLTLTAKAQAEAKETTITLKDISVSEGKEDIFLKDTEFQITVDSDEQPENGGGEIFIFAILLLISLSISGGILAARKRKQNKNGPEILAGLILCSMLALSAGIRTEAEGEKGDIDGDGNADYTDVELIQRHLTGIELLGEDMQETADLNNDGKTEEIEILDITGGLPEDPENYYAVIRMESLPDLYTGISEFRQEKSGAVSAVIDQEDIIRYDADGNRIEGYAFPVAYRDKGGEHPLIKSAQELFDKMADEPKGTFELTEDLDASGIPADAPAIAGTFTGELDGNGHTISGLDAVLFEKTDGASVSNLTIEGTTLTQNTQKGALSNDIRHSVVTDIRGEHFHTVQ